MPGTVLLAAGLGALALAIVMLVAAVVPGRSGKGGAAGALASIEQRYARHSRGPARPSDPFSALPGWLRALALSLDPPMNCGRSFPA